MQALHHLWFVIETSYWSTATFSTSKASNVWGWIIQKESELTKSFLRGRRPELHEVLQIGLLCGDLIIADVSIPLKLNCTFVQLQRKKSTYFHTLNAVFYCNRLVVFDTISFPLQSSYTS